MVLNGKNCITPKTREKVLDSAKELSYIPSAAAQALKTNRSRCIALFIGDISNPFFPDLIKGAEMAVKRRNYSMIIYDLFGKKRDLLGQIDRAVGRQADGMFFTGGSEITTEEQERLVQLLHQGFRIVATNRSMECGQFPIICTEETQQVEALLNRLIAYGHRHIACLSGYAGYWVGERRKEMYRHVLEQHGIYRSEYIISGGFSFQDGKEAAKKLFNTSPEVTAVMCVTDTIAIGCQAAARELGRRIPEDLSIFGIDGINCMNYFYPEITTIDTHRYESGYEGCMRLIDLIECREENIPESLLEPITIPCSIRHGGTVAPLG